MPGGFVASFDSLPPELQHLVFHYIYPPWYLEYTQSYDTDSPGWGSIDNLISLCKSTRIFELQGTPLYFDLPSIAPLLVCKLFYEAGNAVFQQSFTGHVHIASRLIGRGTHWHYAGVMGKVTTLSIEYSHLRSFERLKFIERLPSLRRLVVAFDGCGGELLTYSIGTGMEILGHQHRPQCEANEEHQNQQPHLAYDTTSIRREVPNQQKTLLLLESSQKFEVYGSRPTKRIFYNAIDEYITKSIQAACADRAIELVWRWVYRAVRRGETVWEKDYCIVVDLEDTSPFDISQVGRAMLVRCGSSNLGPELSVADLEDDFKDNLEASDSE